MKSELLWEQVTMFMVGSVLGICFGAAETKADRLVFAAFLAINGVSLIIRAILAEQSTEARVHSPDIG